jgi:hypothetical protein
LGFPSNTIDYIRRKIYVEKNPAKVKGYTKENMGKKSVKNIRGCVTYSTHGISRIVTKPWNKEKENAE